MGYWMHLELAEPPEHVPDCVRAWCSNLFAWALCHNHEDGWFTGEPSILEALATALQLDIHPLRLFAGPAYSLDEFLETLDEDTPTARAQCRRNWETYIRERETKWQSLQELGACLRRLIDALDAHPEVFSSLPDMYLNQPNAVYFTSGGFYHHAVQLNQAIQWAEAAGIQRLRLHWL